MVNHSNIMENISLTSFQNFHCCLYHQKNSLTQQHSLLPGARDKPKIKEPKIRAQDKRGISGHAPERRTDAPKRLFTQ